MNLSKQKIFSELCKEAALCRICPNLAEKTAVLSDLNGSIDAQVLFIAEAPGRQGADRTRKPFFGDKSGENFTKLLDSIGLNREEIFITNSALCSPRSETGANRKPTRREISNCSSFLKRQIDLINPRIVVSLGAVALEALKAIEYHQLSLKNVGEVVGWNSRILIPLYHPSPQVIASRRNFNEQLVDFQLINKALKNLKL